jgi:hypothetical protein
MLQGYECLSCVQNSFERSLPSSPAVSASFSLYPLANIEWTILQLDAVHFTLRQELHSFSIYKRNVSQIQYQIAVGQFQIEQPLQLSNVFDLDSAAESKDDLSVCRSFDLQHRSISDVITFLVGMKAIWTPVANH